MPSQLFNTHGCRARQKSNGAPRIYIPNIDLLRWGILKYGEPIPETLAFEWYFTHTSMKLIPSKSGLTMHKYREGFRFPIPERLLTVQHWDEWDRYIYYWDMALVIERCDKCHADAQAPTEPDAPPKPDTQTKTATTIHALEPIHDPAFLRILARGHETYSEADRRTILGVLAHWDKTKEHITQYDKWATTLLTLPAGPDGVAAGYRTEVRLRIKDILKIILRNAIELAQKEL